MKKLLTILSVTCCLVVNAQNVGIGTTSPAMKLHISSNADTALIQIDNTSALANNNNVGLYFKNGSYYTGAIKTVGTGTNVARLGLYTFAAPGQNQLFERLSVLDNGNIGIGTITPSSKLEVNGQIKMSGGSPGAGKLLESDASGLASWVDKSSSFLPTGATGNTLRHNGTAWIANSTLYNDGSKIGIGTSAPGSLLEVKSASGTADIEINASAGDNAILRLNKNGVANYSTIRFKNSGTNTWDLGTQGDDNFKLRNVPGNITVMDIDDVTKNIGIRTNDFSETVNVAGNVGAAGVFIAKNSSAGFQFQDRSANAYGGWTWYADAGKSHLYRHGGLGNTITIDQTGKLGISIATPTSPLSFPSVLGKKISLYPGTTGDAGFGVFGNELRINSDYNGADITFGYDNFTNGFTENMRVKGNGNVGVGTNGPAYKLDVNGRMRLRHNGITPGIWFNNSTNTEASFIGQYTDNLFGIFGNAWQFAINRTDGTVYMGSSNLDTENLNAGSGYKLKVFGKIISEEVRVQLKGAWPDYVFDEAYKRMTIAQLKDYVQTNKHLPNIPSAAEVEANGQHLGDMQKRMMEKIEELTLYIIELKGEIDALKAATNNK